MDTGKRVFRLTIVSNILFILHCLGGVVVVYNLIQVNWIWATLSLIGTLVLASLCGFFGTLAITHGGEQAKEHLMSSKDFWHILSLHYIVW